MQKETPKKLNLKISKHGTTILQRRDPKIHLLEENVGYETGKVV
jgi:hypothetical protein